MGSMLRIKDLGDSEISTESFDRSERSRGWRNSILLAATRHPRNPRQSEDASLANPSAPGFLIAERCGSRLINYLREQAKSIV